MTGCTRTHGFFVGKQVHVGAYNQALYLIPLEFQMLSSKHGTVLQVDHGLVLTSELVCARPPQQGQQLMEVRLTVRGTPLSSAATDAEAATADVLLLGGLLSSIGDSRCPGMPRYRAVIESPKHIHNDPEFHPPTYLTCLMDP